MLRSTPLKSRLRQLRTLLTALLLLALSGCQAPGNMDTDADYRKLVNRLEQANGDAWQKLPAAFLQSDLDLQQRLQKLEQLHQKSAQTRHSDLETQWQLTSEMLEQYYGDLWAHRLRHRLALGQDDRDQAGFHRQAHAQLAEAIASSGDGSQSRPWRVATPMDARNWLAGSQRSIAGSTYQANDEEQQLLLVVKTRKHNSDPLTELWFDLSPMLNAFNREREDQLAPSAWVDQRAREGDLTARTSHAMRQWQRGGADAAMEAIQWLREASEAGNVIARETLGVIYASFARGSSADRARQLTEAGIDQFLLAIGQGSAESLYNLAQLYLAGHFGAENHASGIQLLRRAVDWDNADAMVLLGRLHYNGQIVYQDREHALDLLARAAETGHRDARLFYIRHHVDQDPPEPLDARGRQWLQQLAQEEQSSEAMFLLGSLLARGEVLPRDPEAALEWLKRAAANTDDPETINAVAWILTVAEAPELRDPDHGLALIDGLMTDNEAAAENAAYLDTWAAAHAATGDFDRAVAIQERAVARAEAEQSQRNDDGPEYLPLLRHHLEAFRRGETVSEDVP